MKKSLIGIIGIVSLLFVRCGEQETNEEGINMTSTSSNVIEEQSRGDSIITTNEIELPNEKESLVDKNFIESLNSDKFCYVGQFEALDFDYESGGMQSNNITIQFDSVINDTLIYGHSIVAGNLRSFNGSVLIDHNYWEVDVKEPGDDKYDGQFIMELNETILSGKWYANDSKLEVPIREFELKSEMFEYNPNLMLKIGWFNLSQFGKLKDGEAYYEEGDEVYYDELVETLTEASSEINASTQILTKKDLENLYKTDLEIIRNTIYARHGYSFKNRKIRNIFDRYVDWYIPFSMDVSKKLTGLEMKNITLIKRYEKHAETYYDSFGR